MKLIKALFVTTSILVTTIANAGLLTINGNAVKAVDLDTLGVSSFEDFYDYDNANRWSSNIGIELTDEALIFVAELSNQYAVFTTFSSPYGSNGSVFANLSGTAGSLLFLDDPDETVSGSGISFRWAADRNDGYIWSGLADVDWMFTSIFSNSTLSGVRYASFEDGHLISTDYSDIMRPDGTFVVANQVSANLVSQPVMAGLLIMGLGFLFGRKKL
ncbi:hypothetical protein [Glaciecola sp. 1036]|uniref:hypothetical protein n=1 Tax=Alteromonadaceae TaxID=72275 RepID=UPI003CFC3BD8